MKTHLKETVSFLLMGNFYFLSIYESGSFTSFLVDKNPTHAWGAWLSLTSSHPSLLEHPAPLVHEKMIKNMMSRAGLPRPEF